MKKFIKFILVLIIIYGVLSYYKVFDFQYGAIDASGNLSAKDILTIEHTYTLSSHNDEYHFVIETSSKRFYLYGSINDIKTVIGASYLLGSKNTELHWWMLVGGIVACIIVLVFPTGKKESEIVEKKVQHSCHK